MKKILHQAVVPRLAACVVLVLAGPVLAVDPARPPSGGIWPGVFVLVFLTGVVIGLSAMKSKRNAD